MQQGQRQKSGMEDIGDCSLDCYWRSCCAAVPLQKADHGQMTWASAENMEDLYILRFLIYSQIARPHGQLWLVLLLKDGILLPPRMVP